MGRGTVSSEYSGNLRLRQLVKERRDSYLRCTKRNDKHQISREIIQTIHNRGGRFLQQITTLEEAARLNVPPRQQAWKVIEMSTPLFVKIKQLMRDVGEGTQAKRRRRREEKRQTERRETGSEGHKSAKQSKRSAYAAAEASSGTQESKTPLGSSLAGSRSAVSSNPRVQVDEETRDTSMESFPETAARVASSQNHVDLARRASSHDRAGHNAFEPAQQSFHPLTPVPTRGHVPRTQTNSTAAVFNPALSPSSSLQVRGQFDISFINALLQLHSPSQSNLPGLPTFGISSQQHTRHQSTRVERPTVPSTTTPPPLLEALLRGSLTPAPQPRQAPTPETIPPERRQQLALLALLIHSTQQQQQQPAPSPHQQHPFGG